MSWHRCLFDLRAFAFVRDNKLERAMVGGEKCRVASNTISIISALLCGVICGWLVLCCYLPRRFVNSKTFTVQFEIA